MAPANIIRISLLYAACGLALLPCASFAGGERELYGFQGEGDGATPYAVPIMDTKGNLYGTTIYGGAYGYGIVYKLSSRGKSWTETVLHSFAGESDGAYAYGGVVVDGHGNLYGGTRDGGANCSGACGVVYELSPVKNGGWREKILYNFTGTQNSEGGPLGSLTLDAKGNLYGTTVGGGACGYGDEFELIHTRSKWRYMGIKYFCGNDGQAPAYGQLVFDPAGNLYGTTGFGGPGGLGVVFELTPQPHGKWAFAQLTDFSNAEGGVADGGLMRDAQGNLYGALGDGGPLGLGSLYELSPAGGGQWNLSTPYTFASSADAELPFQNPVFDNNGNLFGTTYSGGQTPYCQGCGVIYELVPQVGGGWSESVVYDFGSTENGADGYQPVAGLVADGKGNYYGTTTKGGSVSGVRPCDCGAVFEFTP